MMGLAAIIMVGGVLSIWIGGSVDGVPVSTDSRALYCGTSQTNVALMFNVYSGEAYLPSILETLEGSEVKGTFFIGGCWAEKNESTLKEIAAKGHEIGSHGYLHRDHSKMTVEENRREMSVTHQLLKGILGEDITLFAPPSGAYSSATLDASESMGYRTVLWSKDTIDWRDHDTAKIVERATTDVKGGDLILMHPTENTAEALPQIISAIKERGLTLTVVSDVL